MDLREVYRWKYARYLLGGIFLWLAIALPLALAARWLGVYFNAPQSVRTLGGLAVAYAAYWIASRLIDKFTNA
jgi:hypothetical protein